MHINEEKDRYDVYDNDREQLPGLYVSTRQFSWLTAALLVLVFGVFVVGYFVGKQRRADIQKNSSDVVVQEVTQSTVVPQETQLTVRSDAIQKMVHYAQIGTFGTLHTAQKFAEKLQRKNVPVYVKEQHSSTAQGKKIIWYQVLTEPFEKEDELRTALHKIKKYSAVHDIRIMSC